MVDAAATLPTRRRGVRVVVIVALFLLVLLLVARFALQPQRATNFLLGRVGKSLGLQITAGAADYQLRGTPRLVLHDVVARQPGAPPLLTAKRIDLSLPWSTIRARGADLTVQRIELDSPRLDLDAYQRWSASRPPSARRLPTLTQGLHVSNGSIHTRAWSVEAIDLTLPSLHPGQVVQARLQARFVAASLRVPMDLSVSVKDAAAVLADASTGITVRGEVRIESGDWQVPGTIDLSGPMRLGDNGFAIAPLRLGIAARFVSGKTDLHFTLGAHGPLRLGDGTWVLAPVAIALDGQAPLPAVAAHGALALGKRLVVHLQGQLPRWPDTWPALPAPISESTSPLPFAIDYAGRSDLGDIAGLHLQRDASDFSGRFRLAEVTAWVGADPDSPLPPLDGRLRTPRLDIAGAQLHGVEVTLDDPALPDPP